jgi:site-specific DNA recombinase
VSATIATLDERRLQEAIAEAEQRVQDATLPQVLRGNIGPQAKAGWYALDLEAKRQVIRTVADIRVQPVGRRGNKQVPMRDRVAWRWLIGPEMQPAEGGPQT